MAVTTLSRSELVAWVLFLVLAGWALTLGGGWLGIYSADLRWISLILIALGLATWALVAWRRPAWRPRSAIWPALVIPLMAMAVATALSPSPRLGLEYLAWSMLLVALYLLLVRVLAHAPFRERIGSLAAAMCLIVGLWYVVAVLIDWVEWWGLVGHLARPPLRPAFEGLTYGNPSAVLTMAVLLWAASLAFIGLSTPRRRALVVTLGIVTAAVVVLSGSRAGWLAVAIAIWVGGLLWLASADGRRAARRLVADRRIRLAGGALGLAAVALAVVLLPGVLVRASAGGEDLRTTFFATALRMFGDSLLTGTGPGTWVAQRIAYTQAGEPDYYIPHAHNLYLQTLAESGILGAIAGLVVALAVGWLVVSAIRDADAPRRRVGWAALLSLVYICAHHLLDFYANMPAVMLALALPVAWLDATSPATFANLRLSRWAGAAGFALLLGGSLSAVGVLAWGEQQAIPMAQATTAANGGEWERALKLARPPTEADAGIPAYLATRALAEANLGNHEVAADLFWQAAEADDLPQSWLNLAAEELQLGHSNAARDALERGHRLGRQQPIVNLGAADMLLELGDVAAADDRIVDAILLSPSLAGDSTLAGRPDIAPRWAAIVDRAIGRAAPSSAWEIALVAERPDEARRLATGLDDSSRVMAELVIEAWGGDRDAYARLQAMAEDDPLSSTLVSWCGRIANRFGLEDDLERYSAWSGALNGGDTGELRVASADVAAGSRAGSTTPFYGHYTYRRPTPWDLVVGSLPHLVIE